MVVCGVVPVAAIVSVFLLIVHYRGTSAVIILATIGSTEFRCLLLRSSSRYGCCTALCAEVPDLMVACRVAPASATLDCEYD